MHKFEFKPRVAAIRTAVLGLLMCSLVTPVGCFSGAEREKKPPPGVPGGRCLAPDGHCADGMCNKDKNYCYNPADPCEGFFCGGSDRGVCLLNNDGLPQCQCGAGYQNQTFELYCCPNGNVGDPDCAAAPEPDPASSTGN